MNKYIWQFSFLVIGSLVLMSLLPKTAVSDIRAILSMLTVLASIGAVAMLVLIDILRQLKITNELKQKEVK